MPGQGTGSATHPYSLTVAGKDVITPVGSGGVPLDSIRINEQGMNGTSTLEFLYEDPTKAFALPAGAEVIFTDWRTNGKLFGGFLVGREIEPFQGQQGYQVRCRCEDYSLYLDRVQLPLTWASPANIGNTGEVLRSVLGAIGVPLTFGNCFGVAGVALAGELTFSGIPARSIVEQTNEFAAGKILGLVGYFVDADKALWHYKAGTTGFADGTFTRTPPYNVSDNPGAGERLVEGLTLEYDESQIINAVYLRGASSSWASWMSDSVSVATYGRRETIYDQPRANTNALVTQYGRGFLSMHKDPVIRGSFSVSGRYCYDVGKHWTVEQRFYIKNTALGLSQTNPAPNGWWYSKAVETRFEGGTGHHTHVVHFGGLPSSGAGRLIRALSAAGVTLTGGTALPVSGRKIVGTIG